MRNQTGKIAIRPRSSLDLTGLTSALYACRENTGSTIGDRLGNFADVAMTGTASNPLSTTAGWFKGNGSDSYFSMPVGLFPEPVTGAGWLFACSVYRDADPALAEILFDVGSNSTVNGIFRAQLLAIGGLQITHRGRGTSTNTNQSFGTFDMTSYNAIGRGVDLAILWKPSTNLSSTVDLYVNGTYTAQLTCNFSDNGATKFANCGLFTVGASVAAASPIGVETANTRIANILVHHQAVLNSAEMALLIAEHSHYRGEKPRCLA